MSPFTLTKNEESAIERSETKNIPYGSDVWVDSMITRHGIEQVLRQVGRPKKWWLTPFSLTPFFSKKLKFGENRDCSHFH